MSCVHLVLTKACLAYLPLLERFSVFGGIGIRQQRQALELEVLGTTLHGDPAYFATDSDPSCFDVYEMPIC